MGHFQYAEPRLVQPRGRVVVLFQKAIPIRGANDWTPFTQRAPGWVCEHCLRPA